MGELATRPQRFRQRPIRRPRAALWPWRTSLSFSLAALDAPSLPAPEGANVEEIWRLARKHILEEAELIGVYQR